MAKKNDYFGKDQQKAIEEYLLDETSSDRKNQLFADTIGPAFRELIKGVLSMPIFQKIIGIPLSELEDGVFFHLILVLEAKKYDPNSIGKSGKQAKAYSYFGTVARNYIMQKKKKLDQITPQEVQSTDVFLLTSNKATGPDVVEEFEELRSSIALELFRLLNSNKKLTKYDRIVGESLHYMIKNWHRLEFHSKNQFVRLLCQYTQLKQEVVARSLKKIREILPSLSKLQ